jgi:hypothetical protein
VFRIVALALGCTALAVTSHVLAQAPANQQVALLPAGVERGLSRQLATHALRAMHDCVLDRGYALTDASKLNKLSPALRDCKDARCMPRVHRALGADHVIAIELKRAAGGPLLHAQWNDSALVAYTADVALAASTTDAAETAGQEATRMLLEKQRRGPGPWLSIAGTPLDAMVEIGGKAAGRIPFLGRVDPGPTRVIVRKEGYEEHVESVNVGDAADEYVRVLVALVPKRAVSASGLRPLTRDQLAAKATEAEPLVAAPAIDARVRDDGEGDAKSTSSFHPADVVIGSALMLGGAALAIGPVQSWARDGKCWDPPQCSQRIDFDRGQQLQLAGAAALVITGLLWAFVIEPIGHATAADRGD